MSQANVDAFLRGTEAANRGDVEEVIATATEDVVMWALRSPVDGEYRGHDGLRKLQADNDENFDVWRIDFTDVRDLGDRVLAIGTLHIRGRGGGVETDVPTAGIATFEDGKLKRWHDFGDRRKALAAAGLSE
jgi:ketosteroid isomerase-like protein